MSTFLDRIIGNQWVRRAADEFLARYAHRRVRELDEMDVVHVQERTLRDLVKHAQRTRFGREHRFAEIGSLADYHAMVPLQTYEDFWTKYWEPGYPDVTNTTWPDHIPYFALSSGTSSGTTKYIPVSREMVESNSKAALTTIAFFRHHFPKSELLTGEFFFFGGSTDLRDVGHGSRAGDLSGIATCEASWYMRPYTFPPEELSLLTDWEVKVRRLAEESAKLPITAISGVPAWMLVLFDRLKQVTGKEHIAEIWPTLRLVIHGGTKFDPYQELFRKEIGSDEVKYIETYPCSEGFVATEDPRYQLLRIVPDHGIFFEFVPMSELDSDRPTRHTLRNVELGEQYAVVLTTCAGLWSYIVGDTVAFERRNPPLCRFTGRTKYYLSAFGEHLISEEVEKAVTEAASEVGADVVDFHVGPVFPDEPRQPGKHRYFVEFAGEPPSDLGKFAQTIDRVLSRLNEDYEVHRGGDISMLKPEVRVVPHGGFADWMRSRGKYGGQNKVPRMDNTGEITREIGEWLEEARG